MEIAYPCISLILELHGNSFAEVFKNSQIQV